MRSGSGSMAWGPAARSTVVGHALAGNRLVRGLQHLGQVGSTQDALRELARSDTPSGTVIVADLQRTGRGRSGNRWEDDPSGGNLAMSLLLEVGAAPLDATVIGLVPHALGIAVLDACGDLGAGVGALRLKWPNDVVHRATPDGPPRKVAGVLVERERVASSAPREVLLCGIGINVDVGAGRPDDRTDVATVLGTAIDRAAMLAALLTALDAALLALARPDALLERYRQVSDTLGRAVRVMVAGEGPLVGEATGIDDGGRLLITSDGRTRAVLSGTVRDAGASDADPLLRGVGR